MAGCSKKQRGETRRASLPLPGASLWRRAQYPLAFRSVPMNVPLRKVFGHSGWMNGEAGSTVDAEATDDVPAGVVERHAAAERDGEVPSNSPGCPRFGTRQRPC